MTSETITTINFLDRLRTQTAKAHQNLELVPVSQSITSPDITLAAYHHYLSLMADVIASTETRVQPVLTAIIPDMAQRNKAHGLLRDLENTGFVKTHYTTVFRHSEPFTIPFALGIFYVVEGSTLGGRFILKNVQQALGFDAENGAAYFAGYGNQSGSMWKAFLAVLTNYESKTGTANEIIAGAAYAFESIHNHLSAAHEN